MPIRLLLSLAAVIGYALQAIILDPVATQMSAEIAGNQLANSDGAAIATVWSLRSLSHVGAIPIPLLVIGLLLIWWHPLTRAFKTKPTLGLLLAAILGAPQCAWAFADKVDVVALAAAFGDDACETR